MSPNKGAEQRTDETVERAQRALRLEHERQRLGVRAIASTGSTRAACAVSRARSWGSGGEVFAVAKTCDDPDEYRARLQRYPATEG